MRDRSSVFGSDRLEDQLKPAIVDLGFGADADEIAVAQPVVVRLVGVPQHSHDRPRPIAKPNLQVQVSRSVGTELFFRREKDFVDVFSVG
jgi:hypothetical protein